MSAGLQPAAAAPASLGDELTAAHANAYLTKLRQMLAAANEELAVAHGTIAAVTLHRDRAVELLREADADLTHVRAEMVELDGRLRALMPGEVAAASSDPAPAATQH